MLQSRVLPCTSFQCAASFRSLAGQLSYYTTFWRSLCWRSHKMRLVPQKMVPCQETSVYGLHPPQRRCTAVTPAHQVWDSLQRHNTGMPTVSLNAKILVRSEMRTTTKLHEGNPFHPNNTSNLTKVQMLGRCQSCTYRWYVETTLKTCCCSDGLLKLKTLWRKSWSPWIPSSTPRQPRQSCVPARSRHLG